MGIVKKYLKRVYYRLRSNCTTEELQRKGLKVGFNFKRMHDVILDPSHCWHIQIGNDVTLAPRVHILAHDASTKHFLGYTRIGNVIIGNNVFVGADSVILPDVRIGDNVVIGANSTVTKDVPSNSVVAGSPAKIICSIEEFIKRNEELMTHRPVYNSEWTQRNPQFTNSMRSQMFESLKDGVGFVE